MRLIALRLIPAATCFLLLAGCDIGDLGPDDRFQSDVHYSWDLQPGGRLNLETFNGPVEIYASDDEKKVDISGVKFASTQQKLDAITVDTRHAPDAIAVRAVRPSSWRGNGGVRFTVRIPRNVVLDRVSTSNGTIHLRGISGSARLKTSNGAIRVEDAGDTVEAETSNGAIELDSVSGGAFLHTSNGRIRAENLSGPIDAETSNGGITVSLKDAASEPSKLQSSNGSIQVTMQKPPRAGFRAGTSNGGITVYLPEETAARIHAEGSNNSITSEFSVAGSNGNSSNDKKEGRLDGAIGAGGPMLDLSSSHGSIRILKTASK